MYRRPPLSTHPRAVASRRRRRALLRAARAHLGGSHCHYCGQTCHARNLHFHHLVPAEKLGNVAHLVGRVRLSVWWAEVDKCVLACRYCHGRQHDPAPTLEPDSTDPYRF